MVFDVALTSGLLGWKRREGQTGSRLHRLGRAMELQAELASVAKSEALRAADIYEKVWAVRVLEHWRAALRNIEEAIN